VAQAIQPIREITVLNQTFVGPVQLILLVLTILIVVVAGIGIMVSIYNSMSERQHEIAVMRALGARRNTVMLVVLLESVLLSLGGGLVGWLAGHLLVGAAGPLITNYTGVSVAFLQFVPRFELILIPGLIVLASLVGYLPALSAYRTDVGRALTATP
jgi:putative ABC transport system permease protein